MSWFRNPVLLYVAATAVLLAGVLTVASHLVGVAAQQEAMDDARRTTELLERDVVRPNMPFGLINLDKRSVAAVDDFNQVVLTQLMPGPNADGAHLPTGQIRAVRVWDADGYILYADDPLLLHDRVPLDREKRAVLEGAPTRVDLTGDAEEANSGLDPHGKGLVEVYTRTRSAEGHELLLEVYYSASDIAAHRAEILRSFQPITLTGFGLLVLVGVLLIWGLTRRLRRLAQEREDLLRAAVDASDAERRRLARDLHAGVLRDLRETSTSLQELAGDRATTPLTSTRLLALDDGLRGTIRSLRAELLRVYPTAVDAPRLENALADLVAPAAASGIATDVRVTGAHDAPQAHVTLVWRAAQEAVRNAVEHARCRRLEVEVTGDDRHLALRVADDGVGVVPGARSGEGTLGLRALRDLVHEAGGSLDVESGPGRGTTVRMRVGSRS